jgi:hypothetical protein
VTNLLAYNTVAIIPFVEGYVLQATDQCLYVDMSISQLCLLLVGRHSSVASWPSSDIIFAQLAFPLIDINFCLHQGLTYLFINFAIDKFNSIRLVMTNTLAYNAVALIQREKLCFVLFFEFSIFK